MRPDIQPSQYSQVLSCLRSSTWPCSCENPLILHAGHTAVHGQIELSLTVVFVVLTAAGLTVAQFPARHRETTIAHRLGSIHEYEFFVDYLSPAQATPRKTNGNISLDEKKL